MLWRVIDESEKERWNDFISSSSQSPILQSYEWGEVKRESGWEPVRVVVEDAGRVVGAVSILKRPIPYFGKHLFYAPRGPVLDVKNEEVLDVLLQGIKQQAYLHDAIMLKADPFVLEKDLGSTVTLKKKGFRFVKAQVQPRVTLLIDLTRDQDKILADFEEKTRYNIRLSGRKGVEVREMPGEDGVNIFYKLYEETAKRDNFMIHRPSYYHKIRELLLEKGNGGIFIAYYKDEPVAAVYVFCFGSKVWYMYGASASYHRNVMPNHALHWYIIQWGKERGYETYDLWGIPAHPQENHPLWGVYRFKKGFNGREVRLIGMCDLAIKPVWYHLVSKGIGFYRGARSLLVKGRISDSLAE